MSLTSPDIIVFTNFFLSVIIVSLSLWGYRVIEKPTPLYFGLAYTIFASTHLMLLFAIPGSSEILLMIMRISGYILVAVGLFAIIRDIAERRSVERALRESEERLSATFEQAAVGMAEVWPDNRILRCNTRFHQILGYHKEKVFSMNVWDLIDPAGQLHHLDSMALVLQGVLGDYTGQIRLIGKDGGRIWTKGFFSPVNGPDGKPKYFTFVIEDISVQKKAEEDLARLNAGLEERVMERTAELARTNDSLIAEISQRTAAEDQLKQSLHEKEILIKEIHHRVKNNLQIIVSLLYLQAKKTSDPGSADALIDSQTRVKSMSLVHENLYQSGDLASINFEGYLRNLIKNLMVSYGIENNRVVTRLDVKDLPITINTAIPLGLIMNELVSNSLKYAFLPGQPGEIAITGSVSGGNLVITMKDNGRGIPADFDWRHTQSLGLNLVLMLTRQLKGTVELSRESGTVFTLTFPVDNAAEIV